MRTELERTQSGTAAVTRSPLLRHERLFKVGLAIGSLMLTLAALEGVARAVRQRAPGKEAGTVDLYTEFDPLLGWRKRPGAHATRRTPEYTVDVSINSLGLRDKERSYAAPPGAFRILALGDSFVEAYTVPLEESVTQVLERSLASRGPAEVIDGGTAGYSTSQEYLFYVTEGRRYAPNVVLLFFYFNDVLFNARADYFGSPTPLFSIQNDELIAPGVLAPPPKAPRVTRVTSRPASDSDPKLASLEWLEDRLRTGAPDAYDRLAALGLWPRVDRQTPDLQLKVYRRKRIDEIEAAWDLTTRLLRKMALEVAVDGARFAVVYVPSKMEVTDRDWALSRLRYGMDDDRWDRGRVLERLEGIGVKERFEVVDLTPALRAADRGVFGGPYYAHDRHWNATGHRIAAREIRRFLGALGWLPPEGTSPVPGAR